MTMVGLFGMMMFLSHVNLLVNTSQFEFNFFSWNYPVIILIFSWGPNVIKLSLG